MNTVGIIGLGLVGSAISSRLVRGGMDVIGWDVDAERMREFAEAGGRPAGSARELARSSPIILLSLPTTDIVQFVLAEIASELPARTVIDTTTGDPNRMQRIGQELATRQTAYIDATIAGSSKQVSEGNVVVMLGGERSTCDTVTPLLQTFAREVIYIGPCGSGARMKLVVNLVLGLNRAVLAEGLTFASRIGVDPQQTLAVLMAGPAFSRVMETKGQKMLTGDFTPEARLAQHLKDVRLILQAGDQAGAKLPLTRLHEALLEEVRAAGDGDLDNSAIIRAFT